MSMNSLCYFEKIELNNIILNLSIPTMSNVT